MKRLVLPLLLLVLSVSYLIYAGYHIITTSAPDFYVYYYAGRDFINHVNPYSDTSLYTLFTYPPVSLIVFSVLALLPLYLSQALFIIISAISIVTLPVLVTRALRLQVSLLALSFITTCFVFSFPTKYTLGMGQINVIALLTFILGIHISGPPTLKSFIIAIACILKPVLAFCLILYIARRDIKMLAYIGGWLTIGMILSYVMVGHSIFTYYVTHIIPHLSSVSGREVYYNQGILGFVSRLSSDLSLRTIITWLITICVGSLTIWKCSQKKDIGYYLSLLLTTLTLVDTLSWQHHFVFLIYPTIYLAFHLKHIQSYILLGFAYILLSTNITDPLFYAGWPSILMLSHTFYGAFIIWCIFIFGDYTVKER